MPYIRPEGECGRCKMVTILAWTLLALQSSSSAPLPLSPTLAPVELINRSHVPEIQDHDSFEELVPLLEELIQGHDIEVKGRNGEMPKETQRTKKRHVDKKNEGNHDLEKLTHTTEHSDREKKMHYSAIYNIHDLESAEKFRNNENFIRREIIDSNGFNRNDEDKLNSIKILDIGDIIGRHHETEMAQSGKRLKDVVSKDIELVFKQKEDVFDPVIEGQIDEDTSDISKHDGKHDFLINHDNKNNFIDIKERHNALEKSSKTNNRNLHEAEGHRINNKNLIGKSVSEEKKQIIHNHNKVKKNQDDESEKINSGNNDINHYLKKTESYDNCDDIKEIIKDIEDIINDDDEDTSDIIYDDDSKVLKLNSNLKEDKHVKEQRNQKSEEKEFNDSVSHETKELDDLDEIKNSAFEDHVQLLKFDDQAIKEMNDLVAKYHINSKEIPILEPQKQTYIDNARNIQENEHAIDNLSRPINAGQEQIESKHFDLHSPTNFHKNHHRHRILESSHEISKRNGNGENCKEKVEKTFNLSFIFKK